MSSKVAMNITNQSTNHVAFMIIWLAHWTGTMSFSIDILWLFPPALSYFLKDKCPRNTVSWSAAKSGQIPEKVILYWAFLIRFPESFGIIRHFYSNRKMLYVVSWDLYKYSFNIRTLCFPNNIVGIYFCLIKRQQN